LGRDIFRRAVIAGDITFYSIVVFAHVIAAVAGLGLVFAYPILWRAARNRFPRSIPYLFHMQDRIGRALIGPAVGLILLTGLYMVITEDGGYDFENLFVQVGLPIAIYLFLVGPLFFTPNEAKIAELAERDIAASTGDEVAFSAEFEAAWRRQLIVARISIPLVAVAVFFMAVKP
jgi:hypothetical protein